MVRDAFNCLRKEDQQALRRQGIEAQHRRKLAKNGLDMDDSLVDNAVTLQHTGKKQKPKPSKEEPLVAAASNLERNSQLLTMRRDDFGVETDNSPLIAPAMDFSR